MAVPISDDIELFRNYNRLEKTRKNIAGKWILKMKNLPRGKGSERKIFPFLNKFCYSAIKKFSSYVKSKSILNGSHIERSIPFMSYTFMI